MPSNPELRASAPLREIKNRPGRRAKRILSLDLESLTSCALACQREVDLVKYSLEE